MKPLASATDSIRHRATYLTDPDGQSHMMVWHVERVPPDQHCFVIDHMFHLDWDELWAESRLDPWVTRFDRVTRPEHAFQLWLARR